MMKRTFGFADADETKMMNDKWRTSGSVFIVACLPYEPGVTVCLNCSMARRMGAVISGF